jgi:ABC-type transport system involved in Fe-S cluster assembly fused permease/ATPase subunit
LLKPLLAGFFRNVSFNYPGSKSVTGALINVSFSIKPGQLVIIVGANGSGKSTVIKLLSRLYDVTSGEILVDGLPIQDYNITDLHDATATLTQNNLIYPLSLARNIGLGYPGFVGDAEMVQEAAKQGGADELINNLSDGFETTLDPVKTAYTSYLELPKYQALQNIVDNMELPAQISGCVLYLYSYIKKFLYRFIRRGETTGCGVSAF